jgi:hypothetical protein
MVVSACGQSTGSDGITGAPDSGAAGAVALDAGGSGGLGGASSLVPPPDPDAPIATGGPITFAIDRLYFGDTDWLGNSSTAGWKEIGLNLDGWVSTATSTQHCTLFPGSVSAILKTDGTAGRDNSFGSNVLPLVHSLRADWSAEVNEGIANGAFTWLFHMEAFSPTLPSQNGIRGALYAGAPMTTHPLWDGSDVWPIAYSSVANGDPSVPNVRFESAYVVSNVWVSGPSTIPIPLELPFEDSALSLRIHRAQVVAEVRQTPGGLALVEGVFGGVLHVEEVIEAFLRILQAMDPALCQTATFDTIADAFRRMCDILEDGTQDPSRPCEAISIGLGFHASPAHLGSVGAPQPPPSSCPP